MKRILILAVALLCVTTLVMAQAEKVETVKEMLADKAKQEGRQAAASETAKVQDAVMEPVATVSKVTQDVLTAPLVPTPSVSVSPEYVIGADDMLDINVLQPEKMLVPVTVSPDGTITFPYIGTVQVKGMTLAQAQEEIQTRLADGYMKYPVVSVALKQSTSEKFFVYGEVMKPGTYRLEEKMSVLKAISLAGGFTKFGSSSRVKVLRSKEGEAGYNVIKVNLNAAMKGSSKDDVILKQGDIVVVEEGIF